MEEVFHFISLGNACGLEVRDAVMETLWELVGMPWSLEAPNKSMLWKFEIE